MLILILAASLAFLLGFIGGYYSSVIVSNNDKPLLAFTFLIISCALASAGAMLAVYYTLF